MNNLKKIHLLKISVVFLFLLPVFLFYSGFFTFGIVSGQAGGFLIAAPTGVTATDNAYSTKVGLRWDTMRGATVYRIFRSTTNSPTTATDVGTTAANYFFDTTAAQNQNYFYWIRAENGSAQSDFSQAETGVRAAGNVTGNPLQPPTAPTGNAVTAAKASLGKALFWDEQLSSTRTVSCGTCHASSTGGIDKRTGTQRTRSDNPGFDGILNTADDVFGSPGVMANNANGSYNWSQNYGFGEQVTARRGMAYTDAAYSNSLFWDGRATATFRDPITNAVVLANGAALESQVLGPPVSDAEMAHSGRNWIDVANRITGAKPLALASNVPTGLQNWIGGRTYPELFEEAFGTPEVTPARIAMAIATHERTLFSDQTPLDQADQGIAALTASEQRGRNLFNSGQTNCNACHTGNLLTDNQFHYIGVRPTAEDTGRFQVSNNQGNLGQFRTPQLRNVELRGAFFHNGRFTTLAEVVDFYARGGDFNAPNKDNNVRPRNLNAGQRADLVAFLSRPLTDPRAANELPPFDRPTLYTESNKVPQITGTGKAGAGGFVPQVYAIEPPLAGNPAFTVGVTKTLGSANAVLVIDANDPGIDAGIPANGALARVSISLVGNGAGNGYGSATVSIPNDAAMIGRTFYGRWYITDAAAANGFSVSPAFKFTVFGEASNSTGRAFADFDGDGKTDVSVFRPSEGSWHISNSSSGSAAANVFGTGGDQIVPADFDGDGKTDIAVFRAGIWHVLQSSDGSYKYFQFGQAVDLPQFGDFDGDGQADAAVFRQSNGFWYVRRADGSFDSIPFGSSGDKPVAADYDGDGKFDIAVFRDGVWYIRQSRDGLKTMRFGAAGDRPVLGDYDGDGKADAAVFRPSEGAWYILRSSDNNVQTTQWGLGSDVPVPGDYDGDGKTDVAVFRASGGNWYIRQSSDSSFKARNWGTNGDIPAPSAIVP